MKYLLPFLALFLSLSSFAQSEHPEQKNVEESARRFIKLILINEYDEAKAMSTPSTASIIDELKESRKNSNEEKEEWEKEAAEMRKSQVIFKAFDYKETSEGEYCMATFVFSTKPNKNEEIIMKKGGSQWLADLVSEAQNEFTEAVEFEVEDAADAVEEIVEDIVVEEVEAEEIELKKK